MPANHSFSSVQKISTRAPFDGREEPAAPPRLRGFAAFGSVRGADAVAGADAVTAAEETGSLDDPVSALFVAARAAFAPRRSRSS